MASMGKRRKQQSIEKRAKQAGMPAKPHADGDRRRRELSVRVEDALKLKAKLRQAWLDQPPEE